MSEKDVGCVEHADGSSGPAVETGEGGSHSSYLKSRHLYMIAIGGKRFPRGITPSPFPPRNATID